MNPSKQRYSVILYTAGVLAENSMVSMLLFLTRVCIAAFVFFHCEILAFGLHKLLVWQVVYQVGCSILLALFATLAEP